MVFTKKNFFSISWTFFLQWGYYWPSLGFLLRLEEEYWFLQLEEEFWFYWVFFYRKYYLFRWRFDLIVKMSKTAASTKFFWTREVFCSSVFWLIDFLTWKKIFERLAHIDDSFSRSVLSLAKTYLSVILIWQWILSISKLQEFAVFEANWSHEFCFSKWGKF